VFRMRAGRGVAAALVVAVAGAFAQPQPANQDLVRIGKVVVDRASRSAEVEGTICLRQGILDYLAVAPGSGKEYESLLVLDCEPSHLHAALLALGARPGPIEEKFRSTSRGDGASTADSIRPAGDRVEICVSWEADGVRRSAPVSAWLIERRTRRPPADLSWTFTGSFFAKTLDGAATAYAADEERLVAALLYHGACVLNVASAAGNPYAGADQGFEVNTVALPREETPIRVIFRPLRSRSDASP